MLRQILFALMTTSAIAVVGCGNLNNQSERNRFTSDEPLPGNRVSGGARVDAEGAAQSDDAPLTISASNGGMFAKGHSWHLNVNPAGQAELTIIATETIRKQFQVSKEQLAEFRKALADGRFFELKGEYGDQVPCGSEQSVTVTAGPNTHTVKVHYLRDSTPAERANLREASRVVRLLVLLRGWFDEAEAVDLRRFDRAVLDAAKE
jgi:hypothetical protein